MQTFAWSDVVVAVNFFAGAVDDNTLDAHHYLFFTGGHLSVSVSDCTARHGLERHSPQSARLKSGNLQSTQPYNFLTSLSPIYHFHSAHSTSSSITATSLLLSPSTNSLPTLQPRSSASTSLSRSDGCTTLAPTSMSASRSQTSGPRRNTAINYPKTQMS